MPLICSMASINQAHSKAIIDATVAKPLLIKKAFYGSTRTVQCWSAGSAAAFRENSNGPTNAACPFWSRGGYLGTVYALHVPVLLVPEHMCSTNSRNCRIELLIDEQAPSASAPATSSGRTKAIFPSSSPSPAYHTGPERGWLSVNLANIPFFSH